VSLWFKKEASRYLFFPFFLPFLSPYSGCFWPDTPLTHPWGLEFDIHVEHGRAKSIPKRLRNESKKWKKSRTVRSDLHIKVLWFRAFALSRFCGFVMSSP
jgi:hypothetical protein